MALTFVATSDLLGEAPPSSSPRLAVKAWIKIVGLRLGADAYVTKPFDMLELVTRVEVLLRRVPASKPSTQSADSQRKISTEHSEVCNSATTVARGSPVHPITYQDRNLRDELDWRLASHKDSPQLAEVVPQLRNDDRWVLSVAKGVIEFLEEIFEG